LVNGPAAGRLAVIKWGGVTVGKLRNWTFGIAQGLIKDYSIDSLDPAVLTGGERSYPFSAEMLWVNSVHANSILAQAVTGVTVAFYPAGTGSGEMLWTLSNAVFSGTEISGNKDGVTMQNVKGEGQTLAISKVAP
jgi:hypothetical protein